MVELDQYRYKISDYDKPLQQIKNSLDLDNKQKRIEELEADMEAPGFWDDTEKSQKAMKELKALKDSFEKYDALVRGLEDTKTLIEMAEEENDASLLPEIDSEITTFEEHLEELRRRLNDWAARECPVLHTPPLACDLSIHLDRVTVESVRRLDQLAPYGAENPTPVFLLQNAVVDGVYPVSDGRHSRLRLRQGNASVYAVWFGMHPEQLPYTTGDVVDAALNLSVYDSPRGAQLSGRILDLHPAGLGSKLAEQAALVAALRRGTPLTAEQKALITPDRSHMITVYRELQARRWHAEDLQPLCAKLGEENTGKTLVAVTALEQVGLIAAVEKGGAKYLELVPAQGKKNLADAPVLKCLEGM